MHPQERIHQVKIILSKRERKKIKQTKTIKFNKKAGVTEHLSKLTLHINDLNPPIKRLRLVDWVKSRNSVTSKKHSSQKTDTT